MGHTNTENHLYSLELHIYVGILYFCSSWTDRGTWDGRVAVVKENKKICEHLCDAALSSKSGVQTDRLVWTQGPGGKHTRVGEQF